MFIVLTSVSFEGYFLFISSYLKRNELSRDSSAELLLIFLSAVVLESSLSFSK